ncbi:anti-sigma factor [Nocardiopsis sp. CNT312]|uniref:anti-sigma factor family protein n=1 Tax=Nocardiopsis sp. CNT312 TaxID=1137268 RepID=UPI0004BC0F07|nr:zf-HC2 domain-containing protein [Nocardiopsis sp. CNT312]
MGHLGERLSALVDGELGPVEHERALIHLAGCETCRFEADMLRRLKRRLTTLGEPEPDHDFLGRLSGLAGGGTSGRPPGPPPGGAGFGMSPPLGSSRPLGGHPPTGPFAAEAVADASPAAPVAPPPADRPVRRRADRFTSLLPAFPGGRYAVAGVAVATALLGSAFVAGGGDDDTPVVEPRIADFALEHALTVRQLPFGEEPPAETVTGAAPSETEQTR